MSITNPRGIDNLSDKFVSSLDKKALKPLITSPNKKVKTIKVCSLSELIAMGFESVGTGVYRNAQHHLWNVERTADGYSLVRNAEEDSDDLEDHSVTAGKKIAEEETCKNCGHEEAYHEHEENCKYDGQGIEPCGCMDFEKVPEEEKKLDHQEEEAHARRKESAASKDEGNKTKKSKEKESSKTAAEGEEDIKAVQEIASKLLKEVRSVSGPIRINGIKYDRGRKALILIYDTPRQYRHPEEYGGAEKVFSTPAYDEWYNAEEAIYDVISKFRKENPLFQVETASDASGPDIERVAGFVRLLEKKQAAEGDLTQCRKCQEIFPKAEPVCPSCGDKQANKRAESESLSDQVDRLRDQALEYFSKMRISPVEEDILNDVINGIEEESGQDVDDEMSEHIKRILLGPDDEETERWSSNEKKAGEDEPDESDYDMDEEYEEEHRTIDTGDPDYRSKYWSKKGPEAKENSRLWGKLVPVSGEAETTHGELLRAINRIQYDRYNNGFGNGPFDDFNNTLLENESNIKKFMADPEKFDEFENEFEDIHFGKDIVSSWAGDAPMDAVMDGVVAYVSSVDKEMDPGLPGLASKQALINPALEKSPEDKEEIETSWGEIPQQPLTEEEAEKFYEDADDRVVLEGPQEKPYKLEEDETGAEKKLPKAPKAFRTMTAGEYQEALPKMRDFWDNVFDENDRYDFLETVGGSDLDVNKAFDELPLSIQDALTSGYFDVHKDLEAPASDEGLISEILGSKKQADSEEMAQAIMDEVKTIEGISKHELTIDMFKIIENYLPDVTTDEELYDSIVSMEPEQSEKLHEDLVRLTHKESSSDKKESSKKQADSEMYQYGFEEGQDAAEVNHDLDPDEIKEKFEADEIGEIASQVLEHQQQMAGTVYYQDHSDEELDEWESGFYEGFADRVEDLLTEKAGSAEGSERDLFNRDYAPNERKESFEK